MVGGACLVHEIELVGFQGGHFDRVRGSEAMLDLDTGLEPAELGLDHRPEIPGGVVVKFEHAARLAIEHDGHAAADITGDDAHGDGERLTVDGERDPPLHSGGARSQP